MEEILIFDFSYVDNFEKMKERLEEAEKNGIKEIKLIINQFCDKDVSDLWNHFDEKKTKKSIISHLELVPSFNLKSIREIKNCMIYNSSINHIRLYSFSLKGIEKDFVEGLKRFSGLKELYLENVDLSDYEIEYFGEYLKNSSLVNFGISRCKIGDSYRFKSMLYYLSSNKSVQFLSIRDISLGSYDVQGIMCYLESTTSLKSFEIKGSLTSQETECLCKGLKLNNSIKEFSWIVDDIFFIQNLHCIKRALLENNSIIKINIESALERINKIAWNMITYLLICNVRWNHLDHHKQSNAFKDVVFCFLLCLKKNQKETKLKIPEFILFEIIKFVNRKSFFRITFPPTLWLNETQNTLQLDNPLRTSLNTEFKTIKRIISYSAEDECPKKKSKN
jgi:hypothetical protein